MKIKIDPMQIQCECYIRKELSRIKRIGKNVNVILNFECYLHKSII